MKTLILMALLLLPSMTYAVRPAQTVGETFSLQQTTELTTVKVTAHGPSQLGAFFNRVSEGKKVFVTESQSQDFTLECFRPTVRGPVCTFAYTHSANSVYRVGERVSRIILPLHSVPGLENAVPTNILLTDKYGNQFILKISADKVEVGLNLN